MDTLTRFKFSIIVLILILWIGVIGYMHIEKWNFLDALYMTIIAITTVGFGEVHNLTYNGKIFTILFLISSVGTTMYLIGTLSQIVIEGQIRSVLGRKKMEKDLQKIRGHYIVCGYGRIGQTICSEFAKHYIPFVVIENDEEKYQLLMQEGYLGVKGSAIDDDNLINAGIERAKGVITVVGSDADNVYITLSARQYNPKIRIISRASDEGVTKKLLRAGADNVVSPYRIGGMQIAQSVIHPNVVDFLEITTHNRSFDYQLVELFVGKHSALTSKSLKDLEVTRELGVIVIGIKRTNGDMQFNPAADTKFYSGDVLIVLGSTEHLAKFRELLE